jgi:uncharacterized membrane protein (UPF0127 family)
MARAVTVTNQDGPVVCEHCALADSPLRRLRGLLGRRELEATHGILIRPAPAIHTWFMRFAIDAVFLDADLNVLSVRPGLKPWRVAGHRGARAILELAAGEAARRDIHPGDRLEVSLGSV